ncbi:lycopene cyclase family protein [Amycolatopsis decaplanina]|uniref:Lycopene beta cyclase n=1 Tax=Amycolatopsis decaplanina DSM 44594 TaxID=1284240 RepID=M2X288_9PSEU|nr:lycopene cyclase family protein [Amycolatopsis decaplanina]EME55091.1 Lycopene beta cyclase [Amycolatopsis decaplanina DSM 44594]
MTILIAGGGLSGLSLVAHLVARPEPLGPIVVVDDGRRPLATVGWASWSAEPGLLDEAVSRTFDRLRVHAAGRSRIVGLGRYKYRFVRGDDLAAAVTKSAERHGDVVFRPGRITEIRQAGEGAEAVVDGESLRADWVFDSVLRPGPAQVDGWLIFRGWHVCTAGPAFDSAVPTFFDFRTSQGRAASFVYVLPRGPQEALVEHTSFAPPHSQGVPRPKEQRSALREYLSTVLGLRDYTVTREESASLPLFASAVDRRCGSILAIGTKAGLVKASTGYAFHRIQADSAAIARSLAVRGHPFDLPRPKPRHLLFDATLLDVVAREPAQLERVFAALFDRSSAEPVLRFLDEESSLAQEAKLFVRLPPSLYSVVGRRHHR